MNVSFSPQRPLDLVYCLGAFSSANLVLIKSIHVDQQILPDYYKYSKIVLF